MRERYVKYTGFNRISNRITTLTINRIYVGYFSQCRTCFLALTINSKRDLDRLLLFGAISATLSLVAFLTCALRDNAWVTCHLADTFTTENSCITRFSDNEINVKSYRIIGRAVTAASFYRFAYRARRDDGVETINQSGSRRNAESVVASAIKHRYLGHY